MRNGNARWFLGLLIVVLVAVITHLEAANGAQDARFAAHTEQVREGYERLARIEAMLETIDRRLERIEESVLPFHEIGP